MRADAFRFSPPPVEVPPSARWALARGFGPAAEEPPGGIAAEGSEGHQWARRLGLVERIHHRQGREVLARELGQEVAARFAATAHRAAGRVMLLRRLVEETATVAGEQDLGVLLLKGIALIETGVVAYGSRPLVDVDVLVAAERAEALAEALAGRGFSRSEVRDTDIHLPPLTHPDLGTLEIHTYLRDLTLDGETTTAQALLSRQLCQPAPELGGVWLPERRILTAHALAHGIAQHGMSPSAYPLLRMLADLQDLAQAGTAPADLVAEADPFLAGTVSARETAAAVALVEHLAVAELPAAGDDAGRFLGHVLAAYLDPDYLPSLKVAALRRVIGRRDWSKIGRRVRHSLEAPDRRPVRRALRSGGKLVVIGWAWLRRRLRLPSRSASR